MLQFIQVVRKRMVRFQKIINELFLNLHGHNMHSAVGTVKISYVLLAVRFSCLLRGRGTSIQDGDAAE
jgi:hypothetical protein